MGIYNKMKDKYLFRLEELIQTGSEIPISQHSSVARGNYITGETRYRHYNLANWADFVEWRTSCVAVLEQVVPKSSLLRRTVDAFDSIGNKPENLEFAISFIKSVKNELENGFLDDLALQIESEVLADYLDQAAKILKGESGALAYIPAAIIAGASLEKSLKTLCMGLTPPEPIVNEKGNPFGMNALIDILKKRQIYNELQAKQLRAWAAIRNSAAHGNFNEFNRQQVELMLDGVSLFVANYIK